jgi:ATP/ADP translocase
MFMKKPRHRVFDYPPRFYKPEKDETEKRKRKLGFSRQRKHIQRRRSPIIWILFLMAAIYIYLKLRGYV